MRKIYLLAASMLTCPFLKKITAIQSGLLQFSSLLIFILTISVGVCGQESKFGPKGFNRWEWKEVNENAPWNARAGLQALEYRGDFYIFGGRTPISPLIVNVPGASTIWGDVWKSNNNGKTWKRILETNDNTHWPARAYFQAVNKGKYMYIIGGQNFNIIDNPAYPFCNPCPPKIPKSDFFNDVWRSENGVHWTNMTKDMPSASRWSVRAGLSAVVFKDEIYVMGGSVNDDASITPQGPARIYYNDVWKSKNGRDWECLTKKAPWAPRAGGIAIVKNGYIYMIGGEDGFTCNPFTPRCPPYYNDVWRTKDGVCWELVTAAAPWSSRPGHQVVVAENHFVLFGGFGLDLQFDPINNPGKPYVASNPMDMWVSRDGEKWKKLTHLPWNAKSPKDIKYDFDALVVKSDGENKKDAIYTFGGDRETFDFTDFTNYLNVDNDVWKFYLPQNCRDDEDGPETLLLFINYPNPFSDNTRIAFTLAGEATVKIDIYNSNSELVKNLLIKKKPAGLHTVDWNARDQNNKTVKPGIYIARIQADNESKSIRLMVR